MKPQFAAGCKVCSSLHQSFELVLLQDWRNVSVKAQLLAGSSSFQAIFKRLGRESDEGHGQWVPLGGDTGRGESDRTVMWGGGVERLVDPLWINLSCRRLRLQRLGWSQAADLKDDACSSSFITPQTNGTFWVFHHFPWSNPPQKEENSWKTRLKGFCRAISAHGFCKNCVLGCFFSTF